METPVLNKSTLLCSTPKNCETSPQSSSSSSSGKQPMSATLKERLKKARRSFHSAFTVAKRLKIDDEKNSSPCEGRALSKGETCSKSQNEGEHLEKVPDATMCLKSALQERELCVLKYTGCSEAIQSSPEVRAETNCRQRELLDEKRMLAKKIQEKEEFLRRLKLVKMYRSKNNPTELRSLISKWRCSSQAMLYELQSSLSTDNRKLSLTQLIDNFGLDDKLLHYIRTEEDFTDA
ncbi:swi5-dependent recombination DNA repair protein 1 homolog [Lacerta agilis]|uniref:swi5-dependent recombination DNA repair protein 1 homolog n=1 Tax=Lacerta agilis TaxID=80427 RepID=UPI0014194961|nr:swi5-dependent recombination DNA repair protein 1 homolog [Lacerta agilis]XP_033005620.1 swi5-dependent recombination DNA repair protein 1 homolog [Lacerta agilis]XP_033005621.1 swi5-dependent recombination DNA repair protein 1 homolog [Lacerta agilis]XP_033005622.1 swi5-dependent recombination DNA repair protein 1 homolog [Lacerta agilis]XP_033005623.1 swi5-dependent recombination DNA repair protein 1 homolog [Lacerta agilis]